MTENCQWRIFMEKHNGKATASLLLQIIIIIINNKAGGRFRLLYFMNIALDICLIFSA